MGIDQIYIGIDVSMDTLDMAAYPSGQIWQYSNNKHGIYKVISKLSGLNPKLIVMEATGGLEVPLRDALNQAGLAVAVINPRRIRDFARAMGLLAKTDKLDAKVISNFAAKIEPSPRAIPDPVSQRIENLLGRREQLVDMLTAEKNRLQQSRDKEIQQYIKENIAWLETQLEEINQKLRSDIQTNPEIRKKVELYKSMKGVGDILSLNLVSMLPELGKLNQREIASLVGLAPLNRDSGRMRGKRTIWGGRAMVRKAFYMPVLAAIRFNAVIRELYLRLIARGKLPKVAIVACMHKMLTILNSMAKNNTHFSYVANK
jgi:transposase